MATCRLCGQMDLPFAEDGSTVSNFETVTSPDFWDVENWQLPCICHPCGTERFGEAFDLTFARPKLETALPDAARYTERIYNVGNAWK